MLVKMETSVVEDHAALDEGKLYDLSPGQAKKLIRLGKAVAINVGGGRSGNTAATTAAS